MKTYWQTLHVECDSRVSSKCWREDSVVFSAKETKTFAKAELKAQGWRLSMHRDGCPRCRDAEKKGS